MVACGEEVRGGGEMGGVVVFFDGVGFLRGAEDEVGCCGGGGGEGGENLGDGWEGGLCRG